MLQDGIFHIETGTVRFWLMIDDEVVRASVSREALHYRYRPKETNEDPLETYQANLQGIEEAVRRRVKRGSLRPVMLRGIDLQAVN